VIACAAVAGRWLIHAVGRACACSFIRTCAGGGRRAPARDARGAS
jgi:hypothetical protein